MRLRDCGSAIPTCFAFGIWRCVLLSRGRAGGLFLISGRFLFTDYSVLRHKRNLDISGLLAYNLFVILCPNTEGWEGGGRAMGYVADVTKRCLSYDDEMEWFEYKKGNAVSSVDDIGE